MENQTTTTKFTYKNLKYSTIHFFTVYNSLEFLEFTEDQIKTAVSTFLYRMHLDWRE